MMVWSSRAIEIASRVALAATCGAVASCAAMPLSRPPPSATAWARRSMSGGTFRSSRNIMLTPPPTASATTPSACGTSPTIRVTTSPPPITSAAT